MLLKTICKKMHDSPSWNHLQKIHKNMHDFMHVLGTLPLRIFLFLEFFMAGLTKWKTGYQAPDWFQALNFPFPQSIMSVNLNWNMAMFGELILSILILLGVFTRFASLGLLYIIFMAVYTVHFDLGWAGWNQIDTDDGAGFKVPLMLAVMALTLLFKGAGCLSLDAMLKKKWKYTLR